MNEFQEKVFGFICKWKLDNDGISPSMTQISEGLGVTRQKAYWACTKLAEQGHLVQVGEGIQGIKVTVGKWVAQGELDNPDYFMWVDTDGKLSARIERAIMAYYDKFTCYPHVVLVNPKELDQQTSIVVDRHVVVAVVPSETVRLRNSYKIPVKPLREQDD
jgi:hypothetical protein